jgi:hypothetical protein
MKYNIIRLTVLISILFLSFTFKETNAQIPPNKITVKPSFDGYIPVKFPQIKQHFCDRTGIYIKPVIDIAETNYLQSHSFTIHDFSGIFEYKNKGYAENYQDVVKPDLSIIITSSLNDNDFIASEFSMQNNKSVLWLHYDYDNNSLNYRLSENLQGKEKGLATKIADKNLNLKSLDDITRYELIDDFLKQGDDFINKFDDEMLNAYDAIKSRTFLRTNTEILSKKLKTYYRTAN